MKTWQLVLATFTILYVAKSHLENRREIRRLGREVQELKSDRPDLWRDSCYRAVNQSCFYADCAVTPIEIMQEKICDKLPEDL